MSAQSKQQTACFSGHRPEKFPFPLREGEPRFAELRLSIKSAVERAVSTGFTTFLCGMARGFDLLCAEAVLDVKEKSGAPLSLQAAIPFLSQADRWPAPDKARYDRLLSACSVVLLPPQGGGAYYRGCYYDRNRLMVQRSSLLICYHDGAPGGTAYTLRLARKEGLPIWNLAAEAPRQLRFDEE